MQFNRDQILKALKYEDIRGGLPDSMELKVGTDSRKIGPGMLFFALQGESFDGHNYAGSAMEQGALAAVVSKNLDEFSLAGEGQALIKVHNVQESMQSLAREYLKWHQAVSTAVTGSVGKTTTKDLAAHFLSSRYCTLKTKANFNNDVGLPLTVFELQAEHKRAVFEMAMRGAGEIARLARIVQPKYAIITNAAPVHLETLGSLEAIAQAKCEVLECLAPDGVGIINGDQELLMKTAKKIRPDLLTFGRADKCSARIVEVTCTRDGMMMELLIEGQPLSLKYPVPAPALAPNFAAAALCAYLQGISIEEVAESLKTFETSDKRLNITSFAEGGAIINDSYNASPLSMSAALETLIYKAGGGRAVAVLGDMFELGDIEKCAHQDLGREAAARGVDLLVCIGKRSGDMAENAIASGMKASQVHHFLDRDSAQDFLDNSIDRSDFVLFKASRAMQLDRLAAHFTGSDDRQRS